MDDLSDTARMEPGPLTQQVRGVDKEITVSMTLNVEMDNIPFSLEGDGDFAVITTDGVSDALALLKKYRVIAAKNNEQVLLLKKTLAKIGLTLCYKNRRLGFMGPGANPVVSKLFTYVTSSKG